MAISVAKIWSWILVALLLFHNSAVPKAEETPSARAHFSCKSRLLPSICCTYPDSNLVEDQRGELTTGLMEAPTAESITAHFVEKQAVLARVRELAGWERLDIDAEVYKDFSGTTRLAAHVNGLYNTYIASLAPPLQSSIPWASLRLSAVAPPTAAAAQPAAVALTTAAAAQPAAVAPTTAAAAQPAAVAPPNAIRAAAEEARAEVGRPQRKKRKTRVATAAAAQAAAAPLAACMGRRAPPPRPTPPGNEAQRR